MGSPIDLVSFVTRAENRVDALLALASGPRTRPELQDETGIPRATLSRILADFRERDLARRDGHRYATTPLGDLLATELAALFESVAAMERLRTVREWLPVDELDLPVERLVDADVVVPEPTDPTAPVRRAEELLADGERVRVLAHGIVPGCLEAVWRGVTEERQTLEWVTTAGGVEAVAADPELARMAGDLLASEAVTGFVHPDDALPLLFLVDEVVFLAVTDDAGTIRGHVETTDGTVRAWAEETIDAYEREAETVSAGHLTA